MSGRNGVEKSNLPDVILEDFEAPKMSVYKLGYDVAEHIIDGSEAVLRRSNPEFGELSDQVCFSLVWHIVRKLPSNGP